MRILLEKIRSVSEQQQRIKGKGKGKEIVYRYGGEVVVDEAAPIVKDPRKVPGYKKMTSLRPGRSEMLPVNYEVRRG
jgi:hypothetical protein